MKTLLSLPPNLVDCFHQIEKVSEDAWFCTSDPVGARLGSGGGTTWLLESCWQKEHKDIDFKSWLALESVSCCMPADKVGVCLRMHLRERF